METRVEGVEGRAAITAVEMSLIALAVGCDQFGASGRAGLASWPCLSRPSMRFGASSGRKLSTEAENLCICWLFQRVVPMPDSCLRHVGVDGRDEHGHDDRGSERNRQ